MNVRQRIFERIYRTSPEVESLPWHRDEPHHLLKQAAAAAANPGRALDVGCGEGVSSTYLAKLGYSVVGIDFVTGALAAAQREAERAGVTVDFVLADVLDYRSTEPFDLVVDSGCLHNLPKRLHDRYRSRLYEWLAAGGSFVLVHFTHRPAIGWVPQGPNHLRRQQVETLFSELHISAYNETQYDVPLPMGKMRAGVYWFTRPVAS